MNTKCMENILEITIRNNFCITAIYIIHKEKSSQMVLKYEILIFCRIFAQSSVGKIMHSRKKKAH